MNPPEDGLRAVVQFEDFPRCEESACEIDRLDLWFYVRRRIGWAGAANRDPRTFHIHIHRFHAPGYDPWIVGFSDTEEDASPPLE
jgi:hypothetical protein